jgi:hypothetical protein
MGKVVERELIGGAGMIELAALLNEGSELGMDK